jgi:phosphatidylserine/phosphatidylglycerophosphate/cardiolipin synthase-like enzyme
MRILTLLLCLFVALTCSGAPASCAPAATSVPGLALGESRPLETTLGNPALPTAQSVWIEMFKGAKLTIDLEEFYFSHRAGEALQPVLDELGRAAARGVQVRLLLDAGMYRTYPQPADSLAMLPNIFLRKVDYRRLAGGVQHSKFIVVDGADAWIGSQNLDWRSLSQIHELGIRVRDARLVGAIGSVFEADWAGSDTTAAYAAGRSPVDKWPLDVSMGKTPAASVTLGVSPRKTTPAGIPWDRDLIIARLEAAKREVSVQVMQYGVGSRNTVDSTLHKALLATTARGVHVRLIAADWALGGNNESTLKDLAAHGVEVKISRVPEWSHGYIPFARVEHCKYMVVDGDWLWIGTSNWEPSYFLTTRNLGLTIHDRALAEQAAKVFAASWSAPTAAVFTADPKLPPREHGEKAPAGATVYGE